MRRLLFAAVLLAFSTALVPGAAGTRDPGGPPGGAAVVMAEGSQLWFVEFSSPPIADGGSRSGILREQSDFRAAAAGIRYSERKAFQTLWNGLSLTVHPGDLAKLMRLPGVREIYPVVALRMSGSSPVMEPQLTTALPMTGADVVQSRLGFTGRGIRVGIIDSGLDYDHPALGGDGVPRQDSNVFPTGRVVAGCDLVGDAFRSGEVPVPDPYPDDCAGHGTHVSGIVGANGAVTGVAPDVEFGAYRVFGCEGDTTADVVIEALELALADGMQVVNMSIGIPHVWPSYPAAVAADRLVNAGVVVVAASGNEGRSGLYSAGAPGVGKKVIGVASFENTHIHRNAFTVSPDDHAIAYREATGSPAPPRRGIFPLTRTGTQTSSADSCAALPAGSLAGQVALIRSVGCTDHLKALHAMDAGALGVVLYANTNTSFTPDVTGEPAITIPAVGITRANGILLDTRLESDPVDLTWGRVFTTPNPDAGLISETSAYGLSPDLTLKPDLGAPGCRIRSTFPLELGSFDNLCGTSMASPHVAGSVALLLEAQPNTPSQAVRDILQNSAAPQLWSGDPGLGLLESVHRQGAGMLRIDRAILATTRVHPGKLSLGESEAGPIVRTLTIENNSGNARLYTLSHTPAIATGPDTFAPSFFHAPSSVSFSANPLVVAAYGTESVTVTISPDAALEDRSLYGGYIRFTADDGSEELRVPFAGFKGDYQGFPVLTPTPAGFPWLAKPTELLDFYINQPEGATYTMTGTDVPAILYHLDHQASLLEILVHDVRGVPFHRAFRSKDVLRSFSATTREVFLWDGMTTSGRKTHVVPNGDYRITVRVLRPLGDFENPAHVESWTSPIITIARP